MASVAELSDALPSSFCINVSLAPARSLKRVSFSQVAQWCSLSSLLSQG